MIESARDIPCPVCHQPAGKPCIYVRRAESRGAPIRAGHHTDRIYAAKGAGQVQRTLLDA